MVTVRLYVEGGGDSKKLRVQCRRGFRKFIEKAGLKGRMPRIVACGGRQRAYDGFTTALDAGNSTPMLLVDAERPVTDASAWEHLRKRDGWPRPGRAHENQCHLMAQVNGIVVPGGQTGPEGVLRPEVPREVSPFGPERRANRQG